MSKCLVVAWWSRVLPVLGFVGIGCGPAQADKIESRAAETSASVSSTAAWTVQGDQLAEHLGTSTASAGDVNGDGYADLIVGLSGYDGVDKTGRSVAGRLSRLGAGPCVEVGVRDAPHERLME